MKQPNTIEITNRQPKQPKTQDLSPKQPDLSLSLPDLPPKPPTHKKPACNVCG